MLIIKKLSINKNILDFSSTFVFVNESNRTIKQIKIIVDKTCKTINVVLTHLKWPLFSLSFIVSVKLTKNYFLRKIKFNSKLKKIYF